MQCWTSTHYCVRLSGPFDKKMRIRTPARGTGTAAASAAAAVVEVGWRAREDSNDV